MERATDPTNDKLTSRGFLSRQDPPSVRNVANPPPVSTNDLILDKTSTKPLKEIDRHLVTRTRSNSSPALPPPSSFTASQ